MTFISVLLFLHFRVVVLRWGGSSVATTSEFIHICFLELFLFSVAMVQSGFPYGCCSVVTVGVLSCTISFSRVIKNSETPSKILCCVVGKLKHKDLKTHRSQVSGSWHIEPIEQNTCKRAN